jgi:hypothetical protein
MARFITITGGGLLLALALALSGAPAEARSLPEVDDEVLVFSGDAYDNEMGVKTRRNGHGIIAVLIG